MKKAYLAAAAAACLVGGCSEEAAAPQQQAAQKAALTPGEYELRWTVSEVQSTDKTTPATELAQGQTGTTRACVGADGTIDPALFAEAADQCTPTSSYVRAGRLSLQLECRREGQTGQVLLTVNGTSTAETLEGEVSTSTYLAAQGDYSMTRTFTGRRTGECPPAAPDAENATS